MARPNQELKAQEVERIKEKIQKATSVIIVDYRGLTVAQDTEMRREFRRNNIDYVVLKNSLVQRAFNELGVTGLDAFLAGPSAFAFGYDDVVAPAKLLADSAKKYPKMSLKAGYAESNVLDTAGVKKLAAIPPKPVLISQLLMMLTTPMRKLAQCLDQIAKQKAQ